MRKLFIAIGAVFAFSFSVQAQEIQRAVHVSLNPARKIVYDSLFHSNDWRKIPLSRSQNKNYRDSVYGQNWMSKMLKVGERMPNLELGIIINNPANKKRFSDFKGKIVILDFWNTSCNYCIASFPKMERLQRRFGDQIQIILVNTSESKEDIERKMAHNITKIPNLPSILNARQLYPYFPTFGVPYHVWIDQYGVIRVIGSAENTHESKIQDLLDGKDIDYLATEATRPGLSINIPYYKLVGLEINPQIYNSFFTSFNPDYAPGYGTRALYHVVDSIKGTKRSTFINCTIEQLYREVYRARYDASSRKKHMIVPTSTLFDVRDSSRYNFNFAKPFVTDIAIKKSRFSYEQIYPKEMLDTEVSSLMLEDLNVYFGKLYGTSGSIEKVKYSGYQVVRGQGEKYKKLYSKSHEPQEKQLFKNGKKRIQYQCIGFRSLFERILTDRLLGSNKILINETGIDNETNIDIELPAKPNITDIKEVLKAYGLDIIEKDIEVERLIIRDTKAK